MADKSSKIPSIYEHAAAMEVGREPTSPPTPAKEAAAAPGTPAGQAGEKVKNVQVLLEVFKKMDSIETDPSLKEMIRSMSDTAEQYMAKLQGGGGPAKPATGEPEAPAKAAESAGGGGGGGAGAGGGGAGGPGMGGGGEMTPVPA